MYNTEVNEKYAVGWWLWSKVFTRRKSNVIMYAEIKLKTLYMSHNIVTLNGPIVINITLQFTS